MTKKVCVITGATGGLGTAACDKMAEKYLVVVSDIRKEKIEKKVAELRSKGYEAEGMVCDTSDRSQCFALAQYAASLGKVQGVIQLAELFNSLCLCVFKSLPLCVAVFDGETGDRAFGSSVEIQRACSDAGGNAFTLNRNHNLFPF